MWLLVVVLMAGLAVAGPVIMVRDQLADRVATPSPAEGAQPAEGAPAAAGGTVKMRLPGAVGRGVRAPYTHLALGFSDGSAPSTRCVRSGD